MVRSLLKHMHLGAPAKGTFAHMLLRVKDPATGQPLPDDLLAGEFGLFFSAGIESAGNAISWTLWGPCLLLP